MNKKDLEIKKKVILAFQNHQNRNFKVAEDLYKKILKKNPNHYESIFLLGTLSIQVKNFNRAMQLLSKAVQIKPNDANANHNLGLVFVELGKFQKAINYCKKAIQIQPNHVEAYNNLGNILRELGEFSKAKNCFKQAIQIQPNYVKAYNNLGNILRELGEFEKAILSYKKAIQIQPNHANAYYNLGFLYKLSGEFKKTKNYYQVAAKYEPENLLFPYELSNFKKEILDSNLKSKIDKIIKEKKSTKKNLAYGNFLLSKYELKNRNYENEFNYLIKGHQYYFQSQGKAFAEGVNYCLNELPKIKELINLKSNSKKDYKIKPIFIVGVPRCGSTLVEKVIASGTKFIPIGEETSTINFFVDKIIIEKKSINLNIEKIKKEVIARYKNQGLLKKENDYIFTDKTLDNFFFIGLIKKIFPNAKVINCRRNSLASIMSIMKNNLVDVAWAHNLEHIFKFFDIYHRVTESFKKKFPNFIYEIEFEQFVSNPEIESKKLLKFCDLPWDIKCLEFYKRKDLVSRTASNIQIRKAIYKDSPDKYSFYKKFLYKYGKKYSWFK